MGFLTEHVEAHVIVRFLRRLDWGRGGKGRWIGQERLELLDLGELDVRDGCDGHEGLETVGDRVGHGGDGRVADVQRDGGNIGNTGAEALAKVLRGDVQDAWVEDGARVVHVEDVEAVLEGTDVEHVQQRRLRWADLDASAQQGHVGGDSNHTTRDLGGNGQSLEEGSLLGAQGGGLGRDGNVKGRDGASTGRGGDLESVDQVTHLLQIAIGHDEADVLLDEREELLKGRVVGGALADRLLHRGVLAHEDVTMAAHTSTDGLELLRGHIVGVADEDALVLGEEAVGFLEISLFPCLSIPFDHFDMIRAVSDYLRYK